MSAVQPQPEQLTSDEERAAACALAGLAGIGSQSLGLIRTAFGTLSAAVSQGARAVADVPGLRADGVASLRSAPDLARRGQWLLTKARELGVRVVLHDDADYPERLRGTAGAPPVLYVWGQWAPARRVAVVGTRNVDDYGRGRTRALVDLLCAAGVEVVSGGALGVDADAHQRALERGGKTTAVIGSGLLDLYPAKNRSLFERLTREGALVTEFALDAPGITTHFPQRNRTIAGISDAVVITRGASDSGALTTCSAASKLGRPVFAVPGQVGDPLAAAPNSLLSNGSARALVTGGELFAALGLPMPQGVTATPAAVVPMVDVSQLPASVRQVLETLGPAPRHVDEIAQAAGLAPGAALAALLRLELDGLCAARPGKYFLRR